MEVYLKFTIIILFWHLIKAVNQNIICYYDASCEQRKGPARFTLVDLENTLEFCTHIIYGYAGLNALSLELKSLKAERDIRSDHFRQVTALKLKYPYIKFLLSVGGDRDIDFDVANKYIQLLESDAETQKSFVQSVVNFLRSYKFDGLDLAYQFPHLRETNKTALIVPWKSFRNLFKKKSNETSIKQMDHKIQFSLLVCKLRQAFNSHDFILSLTVLPNINNSLYFNATTLKNNVDFINLQTFDFTTPELSPTEATYTAPLYSLPVEGSSNDDHSVDYQVNYWISQGIPRNKINVGIAAYGRAWKMSSHSKSDGFPKITFTNGPAAASYATNLPGVLTWTEICSMLVNAFNTTDMHSPTLFSVLDPHRDFVTYAFRPADVRDKDGMWVSYDDPRIAAIKAAYARHRQLGGIALYDVSLDDFRGVCNGEKFPMLRYIKYMFL